jgi:adenosine deaminase
MKPKAHALIEALPKAELHLHIEGGSIYPELALELSEKNKVPLPFHDLDSSSTSIAQKLPTTASRW